MVCPGIITIFGFIRLAARSSSKSARLPGLALIPMTNTFLNTPPEYFGFFQLVISLVDLPFRREDEHRTRAMTARKTTGLQFQYGISDLRDEMSNARATTTPSAIF